MHFDIMHLYWYNLSMEKMPTIRDYFNALMRDVKKCYVFPDKVNEATAWEFFRTIAEDDDDKIHKVRLATHDTLLAIDKHSSFIWPPSAPEDGNASTRPLPDGEIKDGIAYISLPRCIGTDEENAKYASEGHTLVTTLLKQEPIGVVINLSENCGGDCHPMLAALAPLLDDESYVGWADAKGVIVSGVTWDHKEGYARNGEYLCTYLPRCVSPPNKSMPVAVIYGDNTCSSGEVAALALKGNPLVRSFGQATAGWSTSNSIFSTPLREAFGEGHFALTTAIMADRHGKVYGVPIEPDVMTDNPLLEASQWIRQQTTRFCGQKI